MGAKFITLEGGEGTGKSTQCRLLAERLEAQGHRVHITREPGGSPSAERIRELLVKGDPDEWTPMTEALLMTAARVEHVKRVIKPKLNEGTWVISDRFFHSTFAYQGYGHGMDVDVLRELTTLAIGDMAPDLMVLLDMPVASGMERAIAREGDNCTGEDRFEKMDIEFHERLREGFLLIAGDEAVRSAVVDADQDIESVSDTIWQALVEQGVLDD